MEDKKLEKNSSYKKCTGGPQLTMVQLRAIFLLYDGAKEIYTQ